MYQVFILITSVCLIGGFFLYLFPSKVSYFIPYQNSHQNEIEVITSNNNVLLSNNDNNNNKLIDNNNNKLIDNNNNKLILTFNKNKWYNISKLPSNSIGYQSYFPRHPYSEFKKSSDFCNLGIKHLPDYYLTRQMPIPKRIFVLGCSFTSGVGSCGKSAGKPCPICQVGGVNRSVDTRYFIFHKKFKKDYCRCCTYPNFIRHALNPQAEIITIGCNRGCGMSTMATQISMAFMEEGIEKFEDSDHLFIDYSPCDVVTDNLDSRKSLKSLEKWIVKNHIVDKLNVILFETAPSLNFKGAIGLYEAYLSFAKSANVLLISPSNIMSKLSVFHSKFSGKYPHPIWYLHLWQADFVVLVLSCISERYMEINGKTNIVLSKSNTIRSDVLVTTTSDLPTNSGMPIMSTTESSNIATNNGSIISNTTILDNKDVNKTQHLPTNITVNPQDDLLTCDQNFTTFSAIRLYEDPSLIFKLSLNFLIKISPLWKLREYDFDKVYWIYNSTELPLEKAPRAEYKIGKINYRRDIIKNADLINALNTSAIRIVRTNTQQLNRLLKINYIKTYLDTSCEVYVYMLIDLRRNKPNLRLLNRQPIHLNDNHRSGNIQMPSDTIYMPSGNIDSPTMDVEAITKQEGTIKVDVESTIDISTDKRHRRLLNSSTIDPKITPYQQNIQSPSSSLMLIGNFSTSWGKHASILHDLTIPIETHSTRVKEYWIVPNKKLCSRVQISRITIC